jgi:hypothetical protein
MMKNKKTILMLLLGSFLIFIIAALGILLFLLAPVKYECLTKEDIDVGLVEIDYKSGKQEAIAISGPRINALSNFFIKGISFNSPNEYEIKIYFIQGLPPYSNTKTQCWLFGERAVSPYNMIIESEKFPEGKTIKIIFTNSEGEKECIATVSKNNGRLFVKKDLGTSQ